MASGEFGDVTDTLISSVRKGFCEDYAEGAHLKSLPDFYEQIVDTALGMFQNFKINELIDLSLHFALPSNAAKKRREFMEILVHDWLSPKVRKD